MNPKLDIANRRFGRLVAIEPVEIRNKTTYWRCVCDCGNPNFITSRHCLLRGSTKSCGCLRKEWEQSAGSNIIGQKFGRLTVIRKIPPSELAKKSKGSYYLCQCSCGNTVKVSRNNLIQKTVQSCGCLAAENRVAGDVNDPSPLKEGFVAGTNAFLLASKKIRKDNTSGVRGVSRVKNGRWAAHIQFQGIPYYLGSYSQLEEAAAVRREAEKQLYGPFLDWFEENIRPLKNRSK